MADPTASATEQPAPPPKVEAFFAMPGAELLTRYRKGVENFDKRALGLPDQQIDMAFLPDANVGRWPVRVLLGHLADAELVFSHRMRRAVAEDKPVLAVWDENAFIDSGLYAVRSADPNRTARYEAAGHVAVIHLLRRWTGDWLATLNEQQWNRAAMHPERGPQTVKIICSYATWHLEHHAFHLAAKVRYFAAAQQWAAGATPGGWIGAGGGGGGVGGGGGGGGGVGWAGGPR